MLDEALGQLTSGKGSLRCREVVAILEGLGFVVRITKKGHYVYNHPGISNFWGGNFACPHRAGDPVKGNYITSIVRSIRQNDAELRQWLGENDD